MDAPDSWLRHFGCPAEPGDPRVLDAIVLPEAMVIASRLAQRRRRDGVPGQGITELLGAWSAPATGTAGFDEVWDLSFGRARRFLMTPGSGPAALHDASVRLALRLTEMGVPGDWHAAGPPLPGLRLGGSLLPDVLAVESRGGPAAEVIFALADGGRIVALRDASAGGTGGWRVPGGSPLPRFGTVSVMPAAALAAPGDERRVFDAVDLFPAVEEDMVAALGAGAATLSGHAPGMAAWVWQVLRGVAPCRSEAAFRAISGSNEHLPGIIHVSHPLGRYDLAEILLHEAAHQYFYLLERIGLPDDGSDRRLYWSPPIRKERPLSRILMAFHALANVRLFYECCRGGGAEAENYLAQNLALMDEAVAALAEPLDGNRALTPLGRALYEPLADRLAILA